MKRIKPNLQRLRESTRRWKEKTSRNSLTLGLAFFAFLILVSAMTLTLVMLFILERAGLFVNTDGDVQFGTILLCMALISLVFGAAIAYFGSRLSLKPINDLINKLNRLAAGDFKARLKFEGALASYPAFEEIATSFNTLAEALEGTELLRGDFINNFSHEFKTPIVSITGMASLLTRGNLTEEQRRTYLRSIEEESKRLAAMATNVLKLTRVENQTILTDLSAFNLSEQLRASLLLLETKWESKSLELSLSFDELTIEANEELLKEVWINLLDNAVRFSPERGTVTVEASETDGLITVRVGNEGSEIPPEKQKKIFNKFYQADESHATQGNGIGLAIVKRVVELHGGEVRVESGNGQTVFTVELPARQIASRSAF